MTNSFSNTTTRDHNELVSPEDQFDVLINDPDAFSRRGLSSIVGECGLRFRETFGDGWDALHASLKYQPTVAVLAVDTPGLSSFEIAAHLAQRRCKPRMLFFSPRVPDVFLTHATICRGSSYITKDERPDITKQAVQTVLHGGQYFSESIRARLSFDPKTGRPICVTENRVALLNIRQLSVVVGVAKGLTLGAIGGLLSCTDRSADAQKTKAMKLLDVHDKVSLTRVLIAEGVVAL